ncbi:hypothetical protein PPIS_a4618 [Pseudoalteromonas piscicida]|uniref:Uncharacterized protein n=1 Tax=Pseudoalteromonas piscicida TaxID=43662 RepID=A0ABM6NK56_PSEO7|nr:hypothetical protein PPIS_a4618 [Pseudoalteromonas piscicida]
MKNPYYFIALGTMPLKSKKIQVLLYFQPDNYLAYLLAGRLLL